MNKADIIRMAKEAGFDGDIWGCYGYESELTRFAELVAASEREACAKLCEEWGAFNDTAQNIADAIRQRGNNHD